MEKIYTKEEYSKAYTEIIEILRYFKQEEYEKIPNEILNKYEKEHDKTYMFEYDITKDINEQNVSKLTKILMANLYIDYLCSEEEREKIKSYDAIQAKKDEELKKEKYNIEKVFQERNKKFQENEETKEILVIKEENIFKKILKKIQGWLRLT